MVMNKVRHSPDRRSTVLDGSNQYIVSAARKKHSYQAFDYSHGNINMHANNAIHSSTFNNIVRTFGILPSKPGGMTNIPK